MKIKKSWGKARKYVPLILFKIKISSWGSMGLSGALGLFRRCNKFESFLVVLALIPQIVIEIISFYIENP